MGTYAMNSYKDAVHTPITDMSIKYLLLSHNHIALKVFNGSKNTAVVAGSQTMRCANTPSPFEAFSDGSFILMPEVANVEILAGSQKTIYYQAWDFQHLTNNINSDLDDPVSIYLSGHLDQVCFALIKFDESGNTYNKTAEIEPTEIDAVRSGHTWADPQTVDWLRTHHLNKPTP